MPSRQYTEGLAIRREVLGDEYVDNALQGVTDFSGPLQDWLNEHCWGEVWARPGIPRNVRSLVTIAMLCALRAPQEIRTHVRGALRNGCTPEEIREVLLHAAVYCGAPAAVDAFRAAREVIDTWEA
ncbi:MAG TPA: carboxymuconolactone decarboxylase family protein [Burkholderiales bacterium]